MDFPFHSTKTYHQAFPVAYRQWRADSHCNVLHGYALSIHLEFGGFDLDARNWLVDFGGLRPLKGQLDDWFDHTLLVAQDDPQRDYLVKMHELKLAKITEVERTGCEGLSDFIFEHLNGEDGWLKSAGYWGRVICTKVEVRETDANMAYRSLSKADYTRLCATPPFIKNNQLRLVPGLAGNSRALILAINSTLTAETITFLEPGYEYNGKTYLLLRHAVDAMVEHSGLDRSYNLKENQ